MMRVCCYTSFTFAYLPRARVLAETLRSAHPDWTLCAVLVDQAPPGFDPATLFEAFDLVLGAGELGIPDWRRWLFRHDVVEACTAVKGHAMLRLMEDGFDAVVYLDPDIAVFHPLTEVTGLLEDASVVLTPHQIAPNDWELAARDNEQAALLYGVFNLGFIAVRNDAVGRDFAAWWAAQLHRACYDDPANGVFTDQRYCDLVPALFDRVAICRDPGCNVASWNLSRRRVRINQDGTIDVNGRPLTFFHFTKIGAEGDTMVERYAGDNVEVHEIWRWYARQVARHADGAIPAGFWHFGRFSNGAPIPRAARLFWRARPDLAARLGDPFDAGEEGGLFRLLAEEQPELLTEAGAD